MNFHCLFEQSGTFKNVFKKYKHNAFDYDILNDYNETDNIIDLFEQIELEYSNIMDGGYRKTIFSSMNKDNDFIIAFFPCTHFAQANELIYKLYTGGKKIPYDKRSVTRLIDRNLQRAKFFELYLKFTFICKTLGIRTIIENPATGASNYLKNFSPIPVGYYESDRSMYGDNFVKPTNYFAINFKMNETDVYPEWVTETVNIQDVTNDRSRIRSEISSKYADNFYKRFIQNNI